MYKDKTATILNIRSNHYKSKIERKKGGLYSSTQKYPAVSHSENKWRPLNCGKVQCHMHNPQPQTSVTSSPITLPVAYSAPTTLSSLLFVRHTLISAYLLLVLLGTHFFQTPTWLVPQPQVFAQDFSWGLLGPSYLKCFASSQYSLLPYFIFLDRTYLSIYEFIIWH